MWEWWLGDVKRNVVNGRYTTPSLETSATFVAALLFFLRASPVLLVVKHAKVLDFLLFVCGSLAIKRPSSEKRMTY